jgi:MFS family permease
VSPTILATSALAFGALALLAAAAPSYPLEIALLIPLGAASVTFAAGVNSHLQMAVDPMMRGRVMALYSIVFLGSTPIGGPLTGWLGEYVGPRAGLVLAGIAAVAAGIGVWLALGRSARSDVDEATRVREREPENAAVGDRPRRVMAA